MQKCENVSHMTMLMSICLMIVVTLLAFAGGRYYAQYEFSPAQMRVWVDLNKHLVYLEDVDGNEYVHFLNIIPDQSADVG